MVHDPVTKTSRPDRVLLQPSHLRNVSGWYRAVMFLTQNLGRIMSSDVVIDILFSLCHLSIPFVWLVTLYYTLFSMCGQDSVMKVKIGRKYG